MEYQDTRTREQIQKLAGMIREIRICMLTTVEADGELRSRPMAVQEVEFDGDLWFFTDDRSPKLTEILNERQVCVALSDPKSQRYISLSGVGTIVDDHAKMAELWKPMLKAWFPKGLEDPDLTLLKVHVRKAEYWDAPPNSVVHLFGAAKAALTGEPGKGGEHEKINLM